MIAQTSECGNVIGVNVGIGREYQSHAELVQQLQILIQVIEHGINQQRFTAHATRKQVGVRAGLLIEQLAKDHELGLSGALVTARSNVYIGDAN